MTDNNTRGTKALTAGIFYTVGNILIKGITFLTIPLFTRLMSTESYGVFNTFNSYVTILTIFIGLALHASIKNAKYDFGTKLKNYAWTSALLILINAAVVALLAILFSEKFALWFSLPAVLMPIMVLEGLGGSLNSLYNNLLSVDFRYKEYIFISLAYSATSVVLSVLFIKTAFGGEQSYLGRILGSLIPITLISIYILIRLFAKTPFKDMGGYLKYGLTMTLPLIPHGLSQILLNQCDRIMINKMVGESEAGIYSLAYNVATLFIVLTTSTDTAWSAWFYEKMSRHEEDGIKKSTSKYIVLMSVICALLFIGGPFLSFIMGSADYAESRYLVIPLIFSVYFSFLYTLPAAVEYYHKKTGHIAVATLVSAAVNILLNYVCIKSFGYMAAAYTTLFCHILYFIFHLLLSRRIHGKFLFDIKVIALSIFAVALCAAICTVFIDEILSVFVFVLGDPVLLCVASAVLIAAVALLIAFRKRIISFIKK